MSELPLDPRHLGVLSGVPKMIFEPIGHSVQTVQLSCIEISTISKESEMSFHLTTSSRSSNRCTHNDFQTYGMFIPNCAPMCAEINNVT
jgi:hypothetical protein